MTHVTEKYIEEANTAVMLGNFDGLHLGHQKLLKTLIEEAKKESLKSIVFSFFPHPSSYFSSKTFHTIFTSEEKAALLSKTGVDIFLEYSFNDFVSKLNPREFVEQILIKELNCKCIVVGKGFRFGNKKSGDENILKDIAADYGIRVIVVELETLNEEKISSTIIRECIRNKDFEKAKLLLTRPFFVTGTVVPGKKLGRTIGFPTANIITTENKLLPPDGVYKTETVYNGKTYKSMTNIGYNPTVGGVEQRIVETTLFNFNKEIYGEKISIEFIKWLRNEQHFNSIDDLKKQLKIDADFSF